MHSNYSYVLYLTCSSSSPFVLGQSTSSLVCDHEGDFVCGCRSGYELSPDPDDETCHGMNKVLKIESYIII